MALPQTKIKIQTGSAVSVNNANNETFLVNEVSLKIDQVWYIKIHLAPRLGNETTKSSWAWALNNAFPRFYSLKPRCQSMSFNTSKLVLTDIWKSGIKCFPAETFFARAISAYSRKTRWIDVVRLVLIVCLFFFSDSGLVITVGLSVNGCSL